MREICRQDRILDEDRAREIIDKGQYGILSMVNVDGGGYGIPMSYAVDKSGDIYFHCAMQGHKIDNISADHRVTFTVVGKTEVLPDKFTTRHESVVLFGVIQENLSNEERIMALRLIVHKYDGYDNVMVGCTVENQAMADYRLPIFKALPIKHKAIIVAPILEHVDLEQYLDSTIPEASLSGESGAEARVCHYDWILSLRAQCIEKDVPFRFHQTGAKLLKDDRLYRIRREHQIVQANKASINYRIGSDHKPISK